MKVVCIKTPSRFGIGTTSLVTVGKTYIATITHGLLYENSFLDVVCDDNKVRTLSIDYFIKLEEHRENQINKII